MAPPTKKKKKLSSADHCLISSATIGKHQELGRRTVRVAKKVKRTLRKIWVCNWVDIFPFFDHAQIGIKMALISPRFAALVDTHFDGKSELTIWRRVTICKDIGAAPKVSVRIGHKFVEFPLPDRPLPDKIRFQDLRIEYIDDFVIKFFRSNKQIWDRNGTKLDLNVRSCEIDVQPIWDVLARQIWPIFAPNIRHLSFAGGDHLNNLHRLISPTILTDFEQLNSIDSGHLVPVRICVNDGPTAAISSAGQMLSKWLHISTTDGRPKRLFCRDYLEPSNIGGWVNSFKRPFELVNERTQEKLTLSKEYNWLLKRCPTIVGETNDENSDANLNNVHFFLSGSKSSLGPLSAPAEEQSNENFFSNPGPSGQRNE